MELGTVETIKELEIKILNYVHEVCIENNLKYYLIGGTLLGAVRHKGFIPWDDDIDIVMFRNDYDKLIDILNKNINSDFFMQRFKTDPMYTKYITKIRLHGTKFVESQTKEFNMHHGIFIDIFPIDKISSKNEKLLDLRVRMANKVLIARLIRNGQLSTKNKNKTILIRTIRPLLYLIPLNKYTNILDWLYGYENSKDCKYVTNFSSQYGWRKQTFPVEVFGEGVYLEFEGFKYLAPSNWEVILKSIYGNYMKLPPKEKRNSGHDVVNIELGKYAKNQGDNNCKNQELPTQPKTLHLG